MAFASETTTRRPGAAGLLWVAVAALAFAGLAVAVPAYDLAWVAAGGGICAALLARWLLRWTGAPARAARHRGRVVTADLWGLSLDQLMAATVPALERAGLAMGKATWQADGAPQYLAWNRGAEGGFVLVLFVQAPEVSAADLQQLAQAVKAHGTASGLAVTGGSFARDVADWASRHRIRLLDGDAVAGLLNGERSL